MTILSASEIPISCAANISCWFLLLFSTFLMDIVFLGNVPFAQRHHPDGTVKKTTAFVGLFYFDVIFGN